MPQLSMDGGGKQLSYTLVADGSIPPAPYVRRVPICYNCGEPGHTSYSCPKPRKQGDGKGARLCMICQMEGHLAASCPVVLAAKSILQSIKGAATKPAPGNDSSIRLISLMEADDEAFDHEEKTWEHAEELPGGAEEMVDTCYKVSTRTEKRQERLKALRDKRSKKSDSEEKSSAKPTKEYDRTHPNLFFPKVTEDVKQQLEAEEKKEAEEALKKDLVIAEGLRTIDLLTKKLEEVRPKPPQEEIKAVVEKRKAELVGLEERPPTPRVTVEQLKTLPSEADGTLLPFNIKKEVWNCPIHTTVGALLSNHNVYQKELKGLFIRKRRARQLPPVGDVVDVNMIFEDLGQPEVCLSIMGCSIPLSPVDGGSRVNVIMASTIHRLGIHKLEPTSRTMRMANGARVVPVGTLMGLGTWIDGIEFPTRPKGLQTNNRAQSYGRFCFHSDSPLTRFAPSTLRRPPPSYMLLGTCHPRANFGPTPLYLFLAPNARANTKEPLSPRGLMAAPLTKMPLGHLGAHARPSGPLVRPRGHS
ncbi:unnamed protein product [Calypogeia fissa]